VGSYFNHSWLLKSYPTHNEPLSFYFYVYLRDFSQEETLVGLMPWGEPPIFIDSHNPMEERKKRKLFMYMKVPVRVGSLQVLGNALGCPCLMREPTLMRASTIR
jgi:hypothetical protein